MFDVLVMSPPSPAHLKRTSRWGPTDHVLRKSSGLIGHTGQMNNQPRILVVEDDDAIRSSTVAAFVDAGWVAEGRVDGADFELAIETFRPDLVVLDWMLPGRDGPTLARVARGLSEAGLMLLTARDAMPDRLRGFDAGVDDYLSKPFVMAELIARTRALLRRLGTLASTIQVSDLLVDEPAGVVSRAGQRLELTATEMRLLCFLADNRGRVMSTTQILTQVWGYDDYADNLIQVHISALRRKTEAFGPRLIQTVRGLGYVLRAPTP